MTTATLDFLEKASSPIDGEGIFTRKAINNAVEFYAVPMDGWLTLPRSHFAKLGEALWVNDPDILNWINHSCDPNTELVITEGKAPLLQALRDIAPDEEITVDYDKTETNGVKIPCTCKAKNCRGTFMRVE